MTAARLGKVTVLFPFDSASFRVLAQSEKRERDVSAAAVGGRRATNGRDGAKRQGERVFLYGAKSKDLGVRDT